MRAEKEFYPKLYFYLRNIKTDFLFFFLNCCIKHRKAVCHLSSSQTTEGIFSHCVLGWNYSLSSVAYEINRKLQLDVNIKYFWTSTVGIKALKAKLTSFYRADNNLLDYTSRLYQESVYEPSTELGRGKKEKDNLSHDLPSIEKHFISFPESIVRYTRLLITLSENQKI